MSIAVVIPTHPERLRNGLLDRAVASVWTQTLAPSQLIVEIGNDGAGAVRQRGLESVHHRHDRVAFLDSDDEFLPTHLADLSAVMDADPDCIMAYSWFEPVGSGDPFATSGHFGKPFNPATPHHTTVTTMVDRSTALEVGGFPTAGEGGTDHCLNDDWIFLLRMCEFAVKHGKRITHLPKRTWRWHHHSGNTSGKPGRGDSRG